MAGDVGMITDEEQCYLHLDSLPAREELSNRQAEAKCERIGVGVTYQVQSIFDSIVRCLKLLAHGLITEGVKIELEDSVENVGVKFVRQAGAKTNDLTVDASTAAVVLAHYFITEVTMVVYPDRTGEPNCSYYIRTGFCRFGTTCRFNHPLNRKLEKHQMEKTKSKELQCQRHVSLLSSGFSYSIRMSTSDLGKLILKEWQKKKSEQWRKNQALAELKTAPLPQLIDTYKTVRRIRKKRHLNHVVFLHEFYKQHTRHYVQKLKYKIKYFKDNWSRHEALVKLSNFKMEKQNKEDRVKRTGWRVWHL